MYSQLGDQLNGTLTPRCVLKALGRQENDGPFVNHRGDAYSTGSKAQGNDGYSDTFLDFKAYRTFAGLIPTSSDIAKCNLELIFDFDKCVGVGYLYAFKPIAVGEPCMLYLPHNSIH